LRNYSNYYSTYLSSR